MKTHISILAHGAAQATFDRHLPFWSETAKLCTPEADVMVWMPENDKVKTALPGQALGKAEHNGVTAINRFKYIIEFMAGLGMDRYVFFEYDSICLGSLPDSKVDVIGNMFTDQISEQFAGGMFFHPPILFSNHAVQKLNAEMLGMPPNLEGQMWDRYLGLAVKRAGLSHKSFFDSGLGFADNTIPVKRQYDLVKSIIHGCKLIHGIKDVQTLDVIKRAWRLRQDASGTG